MKYSRLGRYSCSSCCWPCCLTFIFLLATTVFHVTAETITTTGTIKYNHQQQPKQLGQQSERQQRQQLLVQHNQQSTHKNTKSQNDHNNQDDTADIISETILQSAMDIIDDNIDFNNNNNKNKSNSNSNSSEKSKVYNRRESNRKANVKATNFPKARTIKVISPTLINIPTTNPVSVETMKLSTTETPTVISAPNIATLTPTEMATTPTISTGKIVTETATTTKMSSTTATTKLLPPIARAYGKIKMTDLAKPDKEKEIDEDEDEDDNDNDNDDNDNGIDRSGNRSRMEILSGSSNGYVANSSLVISNSAMLLYQQQNSLSQKSKEQQQQKQHKEKEKEKEKQQQQGQQSTSLGNVTPLVVLHRGTTPSTLLRLMSEEHEHYASLYAPPLSHTMGQRRERRQEPPADEQVDKCRTFLESDDNKNVINSPDYPNDYPKNINCTRVIVAPKGQIIRLDFRNSFHIEDKEECKFDYLEIRDGQYGFSNLIGKYCGTDFPPEITSKERYLWLHFHSDESIEYSGFTAVYEFIDRSRETPSTDLNCTIEKTGVEGFVNSSDIPEDIRKTAEDNKIPLDCMWRIRVNETWKIQLKFLEFKLVRPNDCEGNFLDIFPEETTMPSRLKNFCGSAGEGIPSESNILHIRFYAEPSTINSTFGILFTAFRERGSAPSCAEGELDCQDSTCISDTLMCNDRDNCKFRWDEEPCKKNKKQDSSEILIIIVVFGLILGGMILTFLVNCIRKIMRDQKIIREHIRQSKESKLDEISRHSKGRSRDNISMAMSPRQKHSETSLHILDDVSQRDYYGVAEISVHSNKTLDIRDKEQIQQQQQQQIERERSREREREHIIMRHDMVVQTSLCEGDTNNDDGDSLATGNDLVTPAATYRSDMGCQTRESLFATALLRQKSIASSEGGSAIVAGRIAGTSPQPHFSTFGYDATSMAASKPKHAATLRHSIRAPMLPSSSIAGSIDSEQLPQSKVAPIRSHDSCHHHHRHHIPTEQALEQSQEPRFQAQIYAQAQPLTSHQYPHQHQHQHTHQHPHQHQHQHQHIVTATAPPATSLPHQHKTKVIIPPLTPVIPTPGTNNETSKHTVSTVLGSTKPHKQKSDDSKGYIDRNSAPDVIIMTSH